MSVSRSLTTLTASLNCFLVHGDIACVPVNRDEFYSNQSALGNYKQVKTCVYKSGSIKTGRNLIQTGHQFTEQTLSIQTFSIITGDVQTLQNVYMLLSSACEQPQSGCKDLPDDRLSTLFSHFQKLH